MNITRRSMIGTGAVGAGLVAIGASWEAYPTGSIGNPALTVQSVEILAPTSNTTGIFPPAPPTPVLTWGSDFTDGTLRAPAAGTVVATLSGAATYRLIPYLSTFTGLHRVGLERGHGGHAGAWQL